MNRVDQKFKELRKRKKKAFIAFITAGDPNLNATEKLALAFERAGVDIIELGVPFSDPLADGPTIQAASQRALKKHVNLGAILKAVARIRRRSQVPIALMTYYNPVFHYGEKKFAAAAKRSGVDALIVPDLPPEEAHPLMKAARRNGLAVVFFLAPTTRRARMKRIVAASTGFIYYVSLAGVTGARRKLPADVLAHVRSAKRSTKKPVCVGFGVSTPAQVKAIARVADGVIVGSAIINQIRKHAGSPRLAARVAGFLKPLVKAC